MKPIGSHAENAPNASSHEALRKRALFRSNHRGCKEMDLVMGQFAEQRLHELSEDMLKCYDALLDEDDLLIWDWVIGRKQPDEKYSALVDMLKEYAPDTSGI